LQALQNATANANAAVGDLALVNLTTGFFNTAIGAAAGAGAGGSAFTGNKEIVLPAESDLSFELSQPLELKQ